jgi:hypothetical protein
VRILTEDKTIDAALGGRSISRFGDGELRLALGGGRSAISQRADQRLARELQRILIGPSEALICLPRLTPGQPMPEKQRRIWTRYMGEARYNRFFRQAEYGSTHVTRPDSAPWIDRPDYWRKVRRLWSDRRVLLVKGTERSLRVVDLSTCFGPWAGDDPPAREVVPIDVPRVDAYEVIDDLEKVILDYPPDYVSVLCCGATATCLAERLARSGRHALDLGHVGMFLRRISENRRTWPHGERGNAHG